jgi:hypothetical protein
MIRISIENVTAFNVIPLSSVSTKSLQSQPSHRLGEGTICGEKDIQVNTIQHKVLHNVNAIYGALILTNGCYLVTIIMR